MSLLSNAEQLFNDYVKLGVPSSSAAALAGVQAYENGPTSLPNPTGDTAGVFGISQWTPNSSNMGRYNAAVAGITALSSTGSVNDLSAQEQYTLQEMQQKYPDVYSALMGGTATTSQIVNQYEAPASWAAPTEISSASDLASQVSGGQANVSSATPNVATSGAVSDPSSGSGISGSVPQAIVQGADTQGAASTIAGKLYAATIGATIAALETWVGSEFLTVAIVVLGIVVAAYGLGLFNKKSLTALVA